MPTAPRKRKPHVTLNVDRHAKLSAEAKKKGVHMSELLEAKLKKAR